jgi:hypothetical protein
VETIAAQIYAARGGQLMPNSGHVSTPQDAVLDARVVTLTQTKALLEREMGKAAAEYKVPPKYSEINRPAIEKRVGD